MDLDLENNGGGGGGGGEGVELLATAEPAANALGMCEITVLCSLAVVLIPLGVLLGFASNDARLQMSHLTTDFQMSVGIIALGIGVSAAYYLATRLCCD